jgi:hypothetical protein
MLPEAAGGRVSGRDNPEETHRGRAPSAPGESSRWGTALVRKHRILAGRTPQRGVTAPETGNGGPAAGFGAGIVDSLPLWSAGAAAIAATAGVSGTAAAHPGSPRPASASFGAPASGATAIQAAQSRAAQSRAAQSRAAQSRAAQSRREALSTAARTGSASVGVPGSAARGTGPATAGATALGTRAFGAPGSATARRVTAGAATALRITGGSGAAGSRASGAAGFLAAGASGAPGSTAEWAGAMSVTHPGADAAGVGSAAAGAMSLVQLLRGGASGQALVQPVNTGPTVSNPTAASSLRVLGGSASPMSAPDFSGAVLATPPRPSVIDSSAPSNRAGVKTTAMPPRHADHQTPRQRWEAAVASRPLEAPRELPDPLRQLARGITGRSTAPRYTTGPATRHALSAAGALGATTGTTVHLPAVPTTAPPSVSVLAHELTHTLNPVRRPRFFLGLGHSAHLDDDERSALAAGASMLGGRHGGPGTTFSGSGLPGMGPAGLGGGASGILGGAGGAGAGDLSSAGRGLIGSAGASQALSAGGFLGGSGGSGDPGMPGALGAAARDAAGDSGGMGAGIVDGLPVGGGVGAMADLATSTARQTVLAAMPGGAFPGMGGGTLDGGGSGGGGFDGAGFGASGFDGGGASAGGASGGGGGASSGAVGAGSATAGGAAPAGAPAAGGQGTGGQPPAVPGLATVGGDVAHAGPIDADRIVEMVEARLLQEIERRGGRWAGVF